MRDSAQTVDGAPGQTSLDAFARGSRDGPGPRPDADDAALSSRIEFHDALAPLVKRGTHAVASTDLVLAPVDLHRRTIKCRLADADRPRDSLRLRGPADVASAVLPGSEDPPRTLDRIDRIPLLEELLDEHGEIADRFQLVCGVPAADAVRVGDQARRELETVTGYHPDRIAALRAWWHRHDGPAAADGRDLLQATVALERQLRRRTPQLTSTGALVRRACRSLRERGGELWQEQFPTVERVWLCGASTISAPRADLLTCLLSRTDVVVHIITRPTSGRLIRDRLEHLLGIDKPGQEVFGD